MGNFNEGDFWKKINNLLGQTSKQVMINIFTLYYMLKDKDVSPSTKVLIGTTLVYLVFPADVVPDVIPIFGLSDDISLIAASIRSFDFDQVGRSRQKAILHVEELFSKKPE